MKSFLNLNQNRVKFLHQAMIHLHHRPIRRNPQEVLFVVQRSFQHQQRTAILPKPMLFLHQFQHELNLHPQ